MPASASVPVAATPEWLEAARAGEAWALAALVRGYQDSLYGLLYRLTNQRESALDLAQETFVRAFQALGSFRPGAPLKPWLFRIANNLFIDHVRKAQREVFAPEEELGPWLDALGGAEDPAIAHWADWADVEAAIAQLPPAWRQALVLRHVEDMPYEEIAEVLGVPLGTAKTWLFRGRDRLRALLSEGARP